jgi:hypothetical protein
LFGAPSQPTIVQMAIQRILLDRQEAGGAGPIFKQRAFLQQIFQPARIVVTEAAPQHKVVTAGNDIDRIDLQNVHLANDRANSFFGGAGSGAIV